MSASGTQSTSAIAEEALAWFVQNRDVSAVANHAAFGAWLMASPVNVAEYLKIAATTRDLSATLDALDIDIDALVRDAQDEDSTAVVALRQFQVSAKQAARRSFVLRPLAVASITVMVLAFGAAVWLTRDGQRFGLPRTFATTRGEHRSWLLPDGTGLELNSDASVVVRFNKLERLVTVERGQALFHVAHEKARRFRVTAGSTGIVAVGTEFDVWRQPQVTVVTVVEGTVAVFASNRAPPNDGLDKLPGHGLAVGGGEQVRIDDRSASAQPSKANLQVTESWVQHRVAFEQQPLGEVADQFNQYGGVPIVVNSARLRSLSITGVFNGYDKESFVSFLSTLNGARVSRDGGRILVTDVSNEL